MSAVDPGFERIIQLTSAFYRWEQRGRGWQVWPYRVALEPPFRPYRVPLRTVATPADDARKHTGLGGWLRSLLFDTQQPTADESLDDEEPEPEVAAPQEICELWITLSRDFKVSADLSEQFLLSLSSTSHPVSFEIVATSGSVVVQVACAVDDLDHVQSQLRAFFPDAVISKATDYLSSLWNEEAGAHLVIDFGLSQECMRPISVLSKSDTDPYVGLLGAIGDLACGETVIYQVLFQAAGAPWPQNIVRSVTELSGEPFFIDAPELISLTKEKLEKPLFAVLPRVAAKADTSGRVWTLARRLGGAISQFSRPESNELLALSNDDYPDDIHFEDVLNRTTHRSGCLLNSSELVSLVHPPSPVVRSPLLQRQQRRTKTAQISLSTELVLGLNTHNGSSRSVGLSEEQRLRHVHVIGSSGTGKSTLLLRCMLQDLEAGRGFALLDPHGDLVEDVLRRVPENRVDDVILVDPSDTERPVGFNILSAHSELEKTLLSSDLVSVFRRLSTSWGDQMTSVLGNAVLAFLESPRGGTLSDLRRFLIEPEFRRTFLETVTDSQVVYFWTKEFPILQGRPHASLLTRLDTFLRPKAIRNMVSQTENKLDFEGLMKGGKVLLVKLSQGLIGEDNSALLGSLFVSKIHQTALSRQSVSEANRRPFYVYLDEFQNFITPSMASLLTGARKYKVGLVLAHQELRQLQNQDRDVAGAVLANAGTRIVFRVGNEDAKTLQDGFSAFDSNDLLNLSVGQAVCRVDRADADFNVDTQPVAAIENEVGQSLRDRIVILSRERYGSMPLESPAILSIEPAIVDVPKTQRPTGRPSTAPPRDTIERTKATRAATPASPPTPVIPTPGRGGAQHKYLQELIRRWADANGWRAQVEQEVLDGLGSVDVALERHDKKVACEISVSSTTAYEIGNIQKCLSAGFDEVVVAVIDSSSRRKLESSVKAELDSDLQSRVMVLDPERLFEHLSGIGVTPEPATTTTVRGYTVKTSRSAGKTQTDRNRRVGETLLSALKRMRKG